MGVFNIGIFKISIRAQFTFLKNGLITIFLIWHGGSWYGIDDLLIALMAIIFGQKVTHFNMGSYGKI
jgi:hypothetical protein